MLLDGAARKEELMDTGKDLGFAIVEKMGHVVLVGRLSETELCGAAVLRMEHLCEPPCVQLVPRGAVYTITLCTEEQAKTAAKHLLHPLRALGALPLPQYDPDATKADKDIPF